jgi:quinoprotein glucose dehydrogenase
MKFASIPEVEYLLIGAIMNTKVYLFCLVVFLLGCAGHEDQYNNWRIYRGGAEGNSYSSLKQIDENNVAKLKVAWTFHTGDSGVAIECNPIIIGNVMYITSPGLKVIALNATTGKLFWKFDPFAKGNAKGVNRGVTYWQEGKDKRIYFAADHNLYALNAETGVLVTSFGNKGSVDLRVGLNRVPDKIEVIMSSPGIIYRNYLIVGSGVSESEGAAPGYVRAYDTKSGNIKWTFHTIPQPGEFGYDTWDDPNAWKNIGGANDWTGLTLDERRGWVFLATGSCSPDFYGRDRKGKDLFANSVIALKATTGKMVWYYQIVHHDLWDYDLPAAPNLVTVNHEGKKIDAVAQVTKTGDVFVLDRETGKPLFPVTERKVASSYIDGEAAWPTQPFPLKPAAFSRQKYTQNDLPNISPEAKAYAVEQLKTMRNGGIFTPPGLQGSMELPGTRGGAEWSGASFDLQTGILYINANDIPNVRGLKKVEIHQNKKLAIGNNLYQIFCATCHGIDRKGQSPYPPLLGIANKLNRMEVLKCITNGRGQMPAFPNLDASEKNVIIDYLFDIKTHLLSENKVKRSSDSISINYVNLGYKQFRDKGGYPAVKPPWGTLNAINLNTGEIVWKVPLGAFAELSRRGIAPTGTQNFGGTLATAGGLVFVGASKDEKFRAFDKMTGKILWEYLLPAGGYATPSTYEINGKQYVVIAAGGGGKNDTKTGDSYVVFSL